MESSAHPKPLKVKAPTWLLLALLWPGVGGGISPHHIYNITWTVTNLMTGGMANATSVRGTLADAFPPLYFDLCDVVDYKWEPGTTHNWHPSTTYYGCGPASHSKEIYVCPGHRVSRECGGPGSGYCAQWGCETTGDAYWKPSSSWDLITLKREGRSPYTSCKRGGKCNPLVLHFTDSGRRATWDGPKSWGLRLYVTGTDPVGLFSLNRQVSPLATRPIGPNLVLQDQRPPSLPAQAQPPSLPKVTQAPGSTPTNPSYTTRGSTILTSPSPGTGDRLFNLVTGAYLALNYSDPSRTQECWLCLVSGPPYYEGVAVIGNYTNLTAAPDSCANTPSHKLTLPEVSGRGLCLGNVPHTHQTLCNTTQRVPTGNYFLTAPRGTYWACNTGLTPCISATVLNQSSDYCVLVEIWPKVTYHEPEYIYSVFERQTRFRREPATLTLALLLGGITLGGVAAGIGTGTTALIETGHFRQLQAAMNADLKAIEDSVSALEKSLTLLSEVVLQNRRGLDMLFLREGGLCAALKEECCFYADHTGIVRDNMAKLRERLAQRQKLFDSQQGWFEGWFNRSPWFATLLTTLMGPLLILLLILLFGACILNRLVQFMRDRLSVIQTLVLMQQYHRLRQQETEIS